MYVLLPSRLTAQVDGIMQTTRIAFVFEEQLTGDIDCKTEALTGLAALGHVLYTKRLTNMLVSPNVTQRLNKRLTNITLYLTKTPAVSLAV